MCNQIKARQILNLFSEDHNAVHKPFFICSSLKLGRENEDEAKEQDEEHMEAKHPAFSIRNSGLCLNIAYPFLGASPGGLVCCKCSGEGL